MPKLVVLPPELVTGKKENRPRALFRIPYLWIENDAGGADAGFNFVVYLTLIALGGGNDAVDPDAPLRGQAVFQLQVDAGVAHREDRLFSDVSDALCAAVQALRAFSRRFARMATKSTSATSDCAGVSACAVNATPAAFAFSA